MKNNPNMKVEIIIIMGIFLYIPFISNILDSYSHNDLNHFCWCGRATLFTIYFENPIFHCPFLPLLVRLQTLSLPLLQARDLHSITDRGSGNHGITAVKTAGMGNGFSLLPL